MTSQHIDALGLTIDLPDGFVQEDAPEGSSSFTFCFEPDRIVRSMHCFSIEPIASLPPDEDITDWDSEPLAAGGILYYRTEQAGGGSGGEIERLEGYLVFNEHAFRLEAGDQREFPGDPDATWVLPIIRTARFDG